MRGYSIYQPAKARLLSFQNVTKTVEEKPEPPTVEEIKKKIEKYNAKVTNCLLMKLVRIAVFGLHAERLVLISQGSGLSLRQPPRPEGSWL